VKISAATTAKGIDFHIKYLLLALKVADTVFEEEKDCTQEQWEAAPDKAEQRAQPNEWPLIIAD
jgi:hypothetical protein